MNKKVSFILLIILCLSAIPLQASIEKEKPAKAIRVAPPAPEFSDSERQAELAKRRAAVGEAMSDNSVLILFSADSKIYANDVDFYYRQENNLYYLTNLKQNNATLVLTKKGGNVNEYLFLPKRNPQFETWNGKMYSNEVAQKISGVRTIIDANEMKTFLESLKSKEAFSSKEGISISNGAETVYIISPEARGRISASEYPKEGEFANTLSGYKVVDARPIFASLRLLKSPMEIKLMQQAIDITTEALMRSMGMIGNANWEYEVHAEVDYTFRRRNADYWGYPSIVGCGGNATTLHYVESQGAVKKGDLMLMDVGAEYDHYTADVTRTFPVNGKFSNAQKDIYQIVYEAQEAAAKTIKPGARFSEPSQAAAKTLEEGLAKIGLITKVGATIPGTEREVPDGKGGTQKIGMPQYRLWYMHGWGHWLGMNVHDVGGGGNTTLKEGMIMTNEPGIYIREDALDYLPDTPEVKEFITKIRPAFEKYKNIGVRIEDDMLVTTGGVEWMTKDLPRSISDIESFMAKASKEMADVKLTPNTKPTFAVIDYDKLNILPLRSNEILSGKTIRSGYVWDEKHNHSHAE
jgi:Xaa-Pro aminopeptidase